MNEREELEQTIAALEAQRAILGDAVFLYALTDGDPQPIVVCVLKSDGG